MGLAVVYGIVKGCGGAITVHSKPEHGATFNVCRSSFTRDSAISSMKKRPKRREFVNTS
ncbi:MAG: hypothetical protein ACLQVJ_01980 [Syntrophobacteraceae bacterium]